MESMKPYTKLNKSDLQYKKSDSSTGQPAELLRQINELESINSQLVQELMKVITKSAQQEKLIVVIKKELTELAKAVKDDLSRKKIRKNLKRIEGDLEGKSIWKELELMVNEMQSNFTIELKKNFPGLTARDIKICVYIKMNFTTKDIAEFLGISTRSVEDNRYRLRKKFQLQTGESLHDFILGFNI